MDDKDDGVSRGKKGERRRARTDEWVCLAERKREERGRGEKKAKERKNPMATKGDMYQPANTKITQCK